MRARDAKAKHGGIPSVTPDHLAGQVLADDDSDQYGQSRRSREAVAVWLDHDPAGRGHAVLDHLVQHALQLILRKPPENLDIGVGEGVEIDAA